MISINNNRNNNYHLILCELHHIKRHGKTFSSEPNIDGHYIVYDKYEPFTGLSYSNTQEYEEYGTDSEYDTDSDVDDYGDRILTMYNDINIIKRNLQEISQSFGPHPIIRNYSNIVSKENYLKPEIAQCIILPTQETIAILKTFWIRIIQRKWKKVFKLRQDNIKKYGKLTNLYSREINISVTPIYNNIQSLKGMLSELKTK
jgi:hypothetical protein